MKRVLVLFVLLCLVATAVFAVDLINPRPLRRAVQPYVEAWGPYDGYNIISDEVKGTAAGFVWLDALGQIARYVIFAYWDGEWAVYEASGELVEIPTNIG